MSGPSGSGPLAGWAPEPVRATDRVSARSIADFSALLDLAGPVAVGGDPVPPLWHCFAFDHPPRQSALGEDGHVDDGSFMPPLPDRRRMFAGGRLQVHAPMRVGEPVERRTSLADAEVKSGRSGEMVFVTVRHEFSRPGQLLLTEEQQIVYRSQPAGRARALHGNTPSATPGSGPGGPHGAEPVHRWRLETPATPPLLFRFSALTHNTHRIHYDHPYVTGVEGYPGLVVHGPLLALLLLEIPRRHLPERPVRAFRYRLTRPVFLPAVLVAGGAPEGEGMALSGGAVGAPASITGSVVLAS